MTIQVDDMTPAEVFAAALTFFDLITHPEACRKRLEKIQCAQDAIAREREAIEAISAENDAKLRRIDQRVLDARRREFEASRRIETLREALAEYKKTKQLPPLPENFEAESADLIAADEVPSADWIAAAEKRAAEAAQRRGDRV
jgi:hypothetical protein